MKAACGDRGRLLIGCAACMESFVVLRSAITHSCCASRLDLSRMISKVRKNC